MLKQFSRLKRTRSLVIVIFAFVVGLSMILFYAPNRNSATASLATSREALARVGGDTVTVSDLTLRKENVQQMYGGQINLAMLGGNRRFLDGLIQERIATREATRLGLSPSDAEVREAIVKQFTDAGKFVGMERYKEFVTSRYGDVTRFEGQIRDSIAAEKLRAFVTAGARVSDQEVQDDYVRQSTAFDLVYVPVVADQLAKAINPSDDELSKYFDEHRDNFRIN
ncbi:MAG: SurA N-terminal domain-containing protein, partial [Acidobacteriota bacterium]|nr:SurA N-terminal domain-containing protein [Acidobacteriota bacterium]